jgi:mono/diheme cytochrome c family protein
MHHRRAGIAVALWLLSQSVASAAEPVAALSPTLRGFFDTHCTACHDAESKKGGLDLAALAADFANPSVFDQWVQVHDRLRAGEMPPPARKKQPTATEREAVVELLNAELVKAEQARRAGDGRAVLRRLNRKEYENTLRDLLGLPGLSVKELLPEDGKAHGFDKSPSALDLSYVQLGQYLEAADAVLDAAIAPHAERPFLYRARTYGGTGALAQHALNGETVFLKDFKYDDSVMPLPTERLVENKKKRFEFAKSPYQGTMGVFRTEDPAFRPQFPFEAKYLGQYKLRMSVWSFGWDKGEVKPHAKTEAAALVADGRTLGYFDAPSLKPTVTEIEVWLKPGDRIQFNAASLWPATIYNRPGLASGYVGPGIAVDWLDVEGPLVDSWPTQAHRRLFGDLPFTALAPPQPKRQDVQKLPKRPRPQAFQHRGMAGPKVELSTVDSQAPPADARRLLADFLPRAFRREVTPAEVDRYVGLFQTRFDTGSMFEVAMRTAYRAALCSPDFLYLRESRGKLDDRAVANRLSYFLWNSLPDDELVAQAERGALGDGANLRRQVERMLRDERAERFLVDFTDQWLNLGDIDATTPDRKLYPEFNRVLRDAMLAETRAFFREMLEKDLSVTHLIDSDFAMLNARLAEHYRLPGVEGSAIRRVELPADCDRGGILTQASVLKVTANGTVTSPVTRGVWVLRKILGRPPEPPPPDVPAIEPDVQGTTTIREMLAKHRSIAACAACHDQIDPPGFALESYDVIGGRQTRYRSLGAGEAPDKSLTFGRGVPYKLGLKVDPSGETADGRHFDDLEGLKQLLLEEPRVLARNLVGQWVIYATGAAVGFADRAHVEKVLDQAAAGRYGIRSLLHEFVQSPLFLSR